MAHREDFAASCMPVHATPGDAAGQSATPGGTVEFPVNLKTRHTATSACRKDFLMPAGPVRQELLVTEGSNKCRQDQCHK